MRAVPAATAAPAVAAPREGSPDAAGEDPDGGFRTGRGRVLLRIVDLAAVALGTGPFLSLTSQDTPGWQLAVAGAATVVIVGLTVQHQRLRLRRGRSWPPALTLTVLAAVVYGLIPVLGEVWSITPAYLLTGLLCALRWRRAWPWAVLVALAEVPLSLSFGVGIGQGLFRLVQICLTAAVLYGLARAVAMAEELSRARLELAEFAVVRERLRVARDLHDSLGQSLTAIGLQAELAQRWAAKGDSARVSDHLSHLLELTQSTGAEMRGLVSNYRRLTFAGEVKAAAALLAGRDVTPRLDLLVEGPFTDEAEQVLAWSLREAVTNMVRHSDVRQCRIAVLRDDDGVALVVGNDGARTPTRPSRDGGNGLLGIADRALSQGGWSQSRLGADGWFELTVHLPADALAPLPADDGASRGAAEEVA